MRKINRTDVLKMVLVLAFVGAIGVSMGAIGRFTPTHAIAEPVFCGSCHPDQIRELNATTHLPHFSSAIYEGAEAIAAGNPAAEVTKAEAVSGGCMMCHNTWANKDKIFLQGYELVPDPNGNLNGQYQVKINDINFKPTTDAVQYNIAVSLNGSSNQQIIRLGTNVNTIKVYVQDPGASTLLTAGQQLTVTTDYTLLGTTGVTLLGTSANITDINASNNAGSVRITYKVLNGVTESLKVVWGDMSAKSPAAGAFFNDVTGKDSCGNPEKAICHAAEVAIGKNVMNQMAENQVGASGAQLGSGSGIYYQHEMAYTSAEYAAKQVKFCGVCHVNKLPPMDADGEPIAQTLAAENVVYTKTGFNLTNVTITPPDWAHRQVQCVRCHGHAGIGEELTGVKSD